MKTMYDEAITYLGCIRVKTSMRELKPLKRSEVAKESIKRLRRFNKLINHDSDEEFNHIESMLDDKPDLRYQGTEVRLRVTSDHLEVVTKKTDSPIVQHAMRDVSFASTGDEETIDYVAYVAKNDEFGRACFVLQCAYRSGHLVLEKIARAFHKRSQSILNSTNTMPRTSPGFNHHGATNLFHNADARDFTFDNSSSNRLCNENDQTQRLIAATRDYLEREPWFHGSELSREQSENRLTQDGDFLVRESQVDPGHFVLSVMHNGTKLHLLFDSVGQVKTKERTFDDISHLIRYHHDQGSPLVAENRAVYLRNGVRQIRIENEIN